MEKRCLAFVKRLSKKLSEDVFEDLERTTIEEVFTDAISSLPEGDLKEALLSNTKLYQETFLKKLQKRKFAENVSANEKPSSKAEAVTSKKYLYNFVNKNRCKINPESFSCLSGEQKCATYGHYLQNLLRFTSERHVIHTFVEETETHKVWLQELKGRSLTGNTWGKDIEKLLQIMSGHKNLNSVVTVMKILLNKAQKEMDHIDQKKEFKGVNELAERLKKFLIVFHMRRKVSQISSSESEKAYVNLMTSLLSIFIELTVLNSRKEDRKKKTARYICGFTNYLLSPWPHSRLDVLLQISILNEEDSEILMPFVRSVFVSSLQQDSGNSHEMYLKHVLAVKFLSQKFKQNMADIVMVTRGKRAGDGFLDWLRERCPDILEEMPVNDKKFKRKQITNFVIDEADEEMVSKLLDALTEDTILSEMIPEEIKWKSEHNVEVEEYGLGMKTDADIFFIDTKGFAKQLTKDREITSEDEAWEDDKVQEDLEEKENEAEENMEEECDHPLDIFFLDTKGSKKELDDRNKSETLTCIHSPKFPKQKNDGGDDRQLNQDNKSEYIESPKDKTYCIGIPSPVKSMANKKRVRQSDNQLEVNNEAGNNESPKMKKKCTSIISPVKSKLQKEKRADESDQEIVVDNVAWTFEKKSTSPKTKKTRNDDQQVLDLGTELVFKPETNEYKQNTITVGYNGTDSFNVKENILLVPDLSVFLKSPLCSTSRLCLRNGKRLLYSQPNQTTGKEMLDMRQRKKNDESFTDIVVTISDCDEESQSEANAVKLNEKGMQDTGNEEESGARSNQMSPRRTLALPSKTRASCDAVLSTVKPGNLSISQSKTNLDELHENITPTSKKWLNKRRVSASTSATKQPPSATSLRRGARGQDEEGEEEDKDDQKLATASFILLNDGKSMVDSFTQLKEHETHSNSFKDTNVSTLSLSSSPMSMKEEPTSGHKKRMSLRYKLQNKDLDSESLGVKPFTSEGHSEKTTVFLSKSRTTSESSTTSRISTRSMTSGIKKDDKIPVKKGFYSSCIQPDADDPEILFSHIPVVQKTPGKEFIKSPSKEKSPKKGYSLRRK